MDLKEIPSVLKMEDILDEAISCKDRVAQIRYSHAFHSLLNAEIQKYSLKYHLTTFPQLRESETSENYHPSVTKKKKISLTSLIKIIGNGVTAAALKWKAFVVPSQLYFFASMALDVAQYYLKKTEFNKLKSRITIHRKPRKLKKVRQLIIVPELSLLTREDVKYLRFVIFLIKERYVNDVVLLVLNNENDGARVNLGFNHNFEIRLGEEDLPHIFKDTRKHRNVLNILNNIGIEYIDYLIEIYDSNSFQQAKLVNDLLHIMINSTYSDIDYCNLEGFLKTCSLLFDEFKLFDLEVIERNMKFDLRHKKMLPASLQANILMDQKDYVYSFTEQFFKQYFQNLSLVALDKADYITILNYLKENYPHRYADIAFTSQFMPIDDSEKLSYFIIAFYHSKGLSEKKRMKIEAYLETDELGKELVLLDAFRCRRKELDKETWKFKCHKVSELAKNKPFSPETRLCILSIVCDVLYEIENDPASLLEKYQQYLRLLGELRIFSEPENKYIEYILDTIIFSTCFEDYKVQKQTDKLISLFERIKIEDSFTKIKFYRLGNLLYVLDAKKAVDSTRLAFELSKDNIISHEEVRVNYAVSLMGMKKYTDAYRVLKASDYVPQNSRLAYDNDLIVAAYLSGRMNKKRVLERFKKLYNDFGANITSDEYIVLNNYVSTLVLNDFENHAEEIQRLCAMVLKTNDIYHQFFAAHNLMIFYYLTKDRERFQEIADNIQIPYLMRKSKKIMQEKVSFLAEHFEEYSNIDELQTAISRLLEKKPFQYSEDLNMQAILWGLIERWYK